MKRENKLFFGVFVLTLIACVFVVWFSFFDDSSTKAKDNQLVNDDLVLKLNDISGSTISLTSGVPITDLEGVNTTGYTFSLKNSGTNNSEYRIKLIDDNKAYSNDGCSSNKLNWSNIKYSLSKNGQTPAIGILADLDGVIDSGVLASSSTNDYVLKLWIKASVTDDVIGQHFHGKLEILN